MTDNEVWVQLYIGEEECGGAFKVKTAANGDIDDLKKAVKKERTNDLAHCDAARLAVYSAGTEFPKEEDELRPGKPVPTDSTDESPLRVVAPEKQPGKL
jgi:Crinkler effector protein N-terminal domain